ncbi:CoA-binding protein [Natribaculum luteum]|uniref:CoA-binding protein n=1 Tax=Natribaculum luteum TaxID=1586232 RepID=A0ABD5P5F2_9EURY|nr:CoA-binding protein [Natribaculum luteum]
MPVENDAVLREILGFQAVAVVGCSRSPGKAAHDVPKYLDEHGYEVIPVNPYAGEILGRRAYDSLADVDEEIDVVCVFRPSDEVSGVVEQAIDRDDVRVIWTQLGIRDPEATRRAESAGLTVVEDRCLKVDHRRLYG